MRSRSIGLAALLCAAGCTGVESARLIVELPPDAEWVATVALDKDGNFLGATGLSRPEHGRVVAFAELSDAASWEVVGYRRSQLQPLVGSTTETQLRDTPLTPPNGSGPQLPIAAWRVAFDDAGAERPVDGERPLTAGWLPDCPRRIEAERAIVVSCAHKDCEATIRQDGCALHIDASDCNQGTLDGVVGPQGQVEITTTVGLGMCTEQPSTPDVPLYVSCQGGLETHCRFEVRTASVAPAIEVQRVALAADANYVDGLDTFRPAGYLTGMEVVGDRVLVGRVAQPGEWFVCTGEREDVLDIIDANSAMRVDTSTLPQCVRGLAPDPRAAGVLVLSTGGGQGRLSRVDATGRVVASLPLAPLAPSAQVDVSTQWVFRLYVDDTGRVWVVHTEAGIRVDASVITEIDASPLYEAPALLPDVRRLPILRQSVSTARTNVIGPDLGGGVAVIMGIDELFALGPDATPIAPRFLRPQCNGGFGLRAAMLSFHAPTRQLVIPATENQAPPLFVLDRDQNCRSVVFPWAAADSYTAVTWPDDPSLVLVGLRLGDRGGVALLDPSSARMVTGALDVGRGPPQDARVDAMNRVWVTLSWDASVVRLKALR